MSNLTEPRIERRENENVVLDVAAELLHCMKNGGSVLTELDVWTDENIASLIEHFVEAPDVSKDVGFFDKLELQIGDLDDGPIVLFAETFLLQLVAVTSLRYETKRSHIQRVLDFADGNYEIPERVDAALRRGVFGGGRVFNQRRWQHLGVLLEFFSFFRAQASAVRDASFEDPQEWKRLVMEAPGTREFNLRNTLLYLGNPGAFLPIASWQHKEWIVEVFCPEVLDRQPSDDVDADLLEIDQALTEQLGHLPDYYTEPLMDKWAYDNAGDGKTDEDNLDGGEEDDLETYSVASIIKDGCFHPAEHLSSVLREWSEEKNLILQGAPGTGKTWLARRLAFALTGAKDREALRAVQFHPGTSYEDFVRGSRPGSDGVLELIDGPLIQHAERARENPDIEHVLLIEEINRGNPAQAFAEMLTLIEGTKRKSDEALELAYSFDDEEPFHLPENFYIIGTMNVADRSLALVDFAFRRRFAFATLEPQFGDAWFAHLKERFPSDSAETLETIRSRMIELNGRIAEDPTLGPDFAIGHSYVTPGLGPSSTRSWFTSVVRSKIGPQLAEYWHEDPEQAREAAAALVRGMV